MSAGHLRSGIFPGGQGVTRARDHLLRARPRPVLDFPRLPWAGGRGPAAVRVLLAYATPETQAAPSYRQPRSPSHGGRQRRGAQFPPRQSLWTWLFTRSEGSKLPGAPGNQPNRTRSRGPGLRGTCGTPAGVGSTAGARSAEAGNPTRAAPTWQFTGYLGALLSHGSSVRRP